MDNGILSSGGGSNEEKGGVLEQLKSLKEKVEDHQSRIDDIESKVSFNFEQPQRFPSAPYPTAQTEVTEDSDFTQDYTFLTAKDTIPEVRECTFAEFKNRFDPKGEDGCYAVDVLVSGPLLQQEIQQEHRLRDKLFEDRGPLPSTRIVRDKALAKVVKMANVSTDLISQAQSKWPRRLRIQSPALLRILARINREKWTDRPRTYYRPFHSLIYQHKKMKQALEELEERWGSQLDNDTASLRGDETGTADGDDSVDDSPEALACVRAYVKYIDEKIMPDYHQFDDKDVSSNARVRFSDLWYLFKTGELVYRRVDGDISIRRDWRNGKSIWKTYCIEPVIERLVAAASDDPEIREEAEETAFGVGCYYVDYTGESFCVMKTKFKIQEYSGEIFISELPVYPIRFCQDWKRRQDQAIASGDSLIEFIKAKHCFYSGWSLTRSPTGDPMTDKHGTQLQQPEHINSEVMVDFAEAFQECPAWRPHQVSLRQKVVEGLTLQEEFRIRWWSGADRASLLGETAELLPLKSGVTLKERNRHISEDPFLKAMSENARRSLPTTEQDLSHETKALLTDRVFAYVFQERKFAQLAVAKLRPSPMTGMALDSLRIPKTVKDAIQGSIRGHFLQKRAEQKVDQAWASLDLIQGKGTGLFILLHGVPGVGKTATAEAIAQAMASPCSRSRSGIWA